jgi:hypothetical protein
MTIFGTILPIRKNAHSHLSLLAFSEQKANTENGTGQVAEWGRWSNPVTSVTLSLFMLYSICTANARRAIPTPIKFKGDMWQQRGFVFPFLSRCKPSTRAPSRSNTTIASLSGVCDLELQRQDKVHWIRVQILNTFTFNQGNGTLRPKSEFTFKSKKDPCNLRAKIQVL